ncbi:MAG: EAL domain-containing protein [Burkholderiales bacterium]|nr:EAL domain-containing protein [Burkholderiales bacterium]
MAVTNQHPHTAASLEVQIRQASKLRVLLIEDNAFDAEILMTLMAQTCYAEAEVICHASIAGALEILSKEHLDIIILDLSLKDSEVSETLSRLKELTVFAPVIISSSLDDKKTIRKIISLGAEDCLPKRDLSSALLERVVTYAIDRWRLARDLHKTNERLTNILGGTGIGTWEWHVPTGAMIIDEDFARILGYSLAALLPFTRDKWIDCIHPEDRGRANELLTRNFTVDNQYYDCEMRVRHKSGQWIWALSRGKLISHIHHNQPEWIVGTLLNITQCKQNEESLRIIQLVYQNTSEAIMITDRNACIIDVNPAFTRLTGYTLDEISGENPKILSSGKQDKRFYEQMWKALTDSGTWTGEIWNRKKNGEEYLERLTINTIYHPDNTVQYRVAQFSDITEKKFADSLIWSHANFDALTNLPNRRLFADRLNQAIQNAERNHFQVALFLIDLDHFKEINDTLGHHIGDALLIEVAKRIKGCLRKSDTVARLGGDEFTVILTQLKSLTTAEQIAQNIIDALAIPLHIEREKINTSASIGITLCPDDGNTMTELLKNADQAMYAVKRNGRSGYSFFTPEMQETAIEHRKLSMMLREALSNNQFTVFFQPIMELHSGKIRKAEALLRWKTSEYGFISPASFIPIAEKTGAIHELGEWIFKQAVDEVAYCQKTIHPDFQISVNMSPVQFQDGSKTRNRWKDYLISKDLHDGIVVEITEGLLLKANAKVHEKFSSFRNCGIQVAIDDFGTGYSSLSYLKKFEIHYVKIDRSFIHNLAPTSEDLALCEAIVVMAHKLGLKVIAEGIETEQQRQLLLKMGCDYGQGFLFARPMTREEFRTFLFNHEIPEPSFTTGMRMYSLTD